MVNAIRQAREARGWTSARLNHELREVARVQGVSTASAASLRAMISMWENGRRQPDATYQLLLQRVFHLPPEALGFADHPADTPADEIITPLVRRGAERLRASESVLAYYEQQLAAHIQLDNATGPGLVLDIVNTQVDQLRTLSHSGPPQAVELAARFAEHAGWLLQDSGELDRALRLSDEAVDLAEQAGNMSLTAYNLMRKSNVLTTAGQAERASVTANRALAIAERSAPDQVAVCLRQVALSEAHLHNEHAARSALDRAIEIAGAPPVEANSISSYCTAPYLEMESAFCLLVVGSPQLAAEACRRALAGWPDALVRDEAVCLVRLACALLDMHHVEEACSTAMMAIQRVKEAPSARTLHMLRVISRRVQPYREARAVRRLRDALALVA